ncbi:MAG: DNA polymerase III subunit epsilon [Wenzhouxiangellaceae bacterium]
MRQVILDTETTGLEVSEGHRVIEIGAVELVERRRSGRHFHRYINPQREVEQGALEVHGISNDFLRDKPVFSEVVGEFLDFIRDAEIIIHNAPFDVGFLDAELRYAGIEPSTLEGYATVLDSLVLARQQHPGQSNSLDALCKRYEIDNTSRTLHGALLDAELLAEVYLALTGGQETLSLSVAQTQRPLDAASLGQRLPTPVIKADDEELAAHEERLQALAEKGGCLWRELSAGVSE